MPLQTQMERLFLDPRKQPNDRRKRSEAPAAGEQSTCRGLLSGELPVTTEPKPGLESSCWRAGGMLTARGEDRTEWTLTPVIFTSCFPLGH